MEFTTYNNAQQFLDKVKAFMEKEEAVNNLPLGLLQNLAYGNSPYKSEPFLAIVEEEDQLILVMVRTPPHNVIVYGEGPKLDEAIDYAVSELALRGIDLPGVIGPKHIADAFAKEWSQARNVSSVVKMNQGIYKLERVDKVPTGAGKLRAAIKNDQALIAQWIKDFSTITPEPLTEQESESRAERFIEQGTLHLWQVGETVVSMVNKTRPTKHGITVNFVYTPPESPKQRFCHIMCSSV